MTKNSYEQVKFPMLNCVNSSKLATPTQAKVTILISSILFISFIIVNIYYGDDMMKWSIKASEAMIDFDASNLSM
jgi:hypothetical protein